MDYNGNKDDIKQEWIDIDFIHLSNLFQTRCYWANIYYFTLPIIISNAMKSAGKLIW